MVLHAPACQVPATFIQSFQVDLRIVLVLLVDLGQFALGLLLVGRNLLYDGNSILKKLIERQPISVAKR